MRLFTQTLRVFLRKSRCAPPIALVLLTALLNFCPTAFGACDDPSMTPAAGPGLYLRVLPSKPLKLTKLKPGDVVEGTLSRSVYAADHKLFSSGARIELRVDHLERRRRIPNDHWPWVVKAFTPRHENVPAFKIATVSDSTGESSLQVSLISISRMRDVHAKTKNKETAQVSEGERGAVEAAASTGKKNPVPTMILEAFDSGDSARTGEQPNRTAEPDSNPPDIVPSGTRCKILLLNSVSASKSKPGDVVYARLIEPVLVDSKVALPAGSVFEGKVIKKTPPRWLSRSGTLYLGFTEVRLPEGAHFPITASLAGAQLDEKSHTRMDAEGGLHGERPGKAWMAINIGVTAGLAKEVDDGVQLVIEAIVSTATDASTAGTARIAATCVSVLYMATRKGRDVVLPRFTEVDISLDRPASLHAASEFDSSSSSSAAK
jgi:hypothetical protein